MSKKSRFSVLVSILVGRRSKKAICEDPKTHMERGGLEIEYLFNIRHVRLFDKDC